VGTGFCGYCGASRSVTAPPPVDDLIARLSRGQVPEQARDGRPTEQRRLVTALFADISGFTALGGEVDPEALTEIVDRIVTVLSEVVGRYDGYVDKYAGDALLAFFGAPTSHEDDAARAIAVALEMHAGFDAMRVSLPREAQGLGLSIGINTGHAIARVIGNEVRTDYSVLGDAINVAQRLEVAAPTGETYVGELTEQLTRRSFELESVGQLTLKGKAHPVAAWRVVRQRAATIETRALVGRDDDLRILNRTVEQLCTGTGGVVIVSGEAGVGKSSLLDVVRDDARARGVRWLDARAVSYRAASPYEPIIELLGILPAGDPAVARVTGTANAVDQIIALTDDLGVSEAAPHLAWLLGAPSVAVEELDPEVRRSRLQDAFALLLRALARRGPLVLAVEDLHWADAATVDLVSLIGGAAADLPLLLLATSRPDATAIDRVRREAIDAHVLALAPLSDDDTAALVEALRLDAAPELVETVRRRSGGNPFFASELVRAIGESAGGFDALALPPTVESALAARLDRLEGGAAHALEVAAAIGTEIPFELLDAAAELPELRAAVKQLLKADLLERVGDGRDLLTFRHALVQEVAYGRILRRRARALHLSIADAAERLWGNEGDAVDVLARHLYHAKARDRAVPQLLRAADRAEDVFANDAAMLHLRRALELFDDDDHERSREMGSRDTVALRLADLCELVGGYEDATLLYRSLLDGPLGPQASYGLAASLRKRGEYDESLRVLDAAGTRTMSKQEKAMLWLERGRALMVADGFDSAITALTSGLELAPSDSQVNGSLLCDLARAESSVARADDALIHALEARRTFEALADLRHLTSALRVLGGVYEDLGRLDDAAEALRAGLALAERTGRIEEIGGCLINLGLVELTRERIDDAISCNRRAIDELERIGHPARATAYANLAEALLARGDFDEVHEYCEQAIAVASQQHDSLTVADASLTAAIADLRAGRASEAGTRAEEAAAWFLEVDAKEWAAKALAVAVDAWSAAGDRSRAQAALANADELG
jgi:class 3 adenylate cyclase/tetratricopeptide (TPR) repeat protein